MAHTAKYTVRPALKPWQRKAGSQGRGLPVGKERLGVDLKRTGKGEDSPGLGKSSGHGCGSGPSVHSSGCGGKNLTPPSPEGRVPAALGLLHAPPPMKTKTHRQ